jgi:SpoVK/Ycf46/Vps4 family AAA+-type ATPase
LICVISQFRDKKEELKGCGFEHKLNIILHGLPGTGKSTAIQAIASYLRRDIYYVDLKDAKTNEDLNMIFEHVNKNFPGNSIICIEDIDAMCDVVKRRSTTIKEENCTSVISSGKSKVTLDYLLNILQGTLTIEDSIFIVTTNHFDLLDPAFVRDGRFDIKIEFKLCDHYQIDAIYSKLLRRSVPPAILSRIKEDKHSPAEILYHIKNYIFQSDKSDEEILGRFLE